MVSLAYFIFGCFLALQSDELELGRQVHVSLSNSRSILNFRHGNDVVLVLQFDDTVNAEYDQSRF